MESANSENSNTSDSPLEQNTTPQIEPALDDNETPTIESQTKDAPKVSGQKKWTREDAIEFYNIDNWGSSYFSVNEKGNVIMLPRGENGPRIEILDVIEDMQKQNIQLPCIIRFQDILRDRVQRLNETFKKVMTELRYNGVYRGVYPVKVNQLREVIEEIVDAGQPYHYGLEAGSKAELQIVLAYNTDPEAITICNGYKDSEFIRLALLGRQLERKVFIVIEQFSELASTIKIAKEVGVMPLLGFRGKLNSRGSGKWEESGGEAAKFGLSTTEILEGIEVLREAGMLDCLQLLHFHIGSQITEIRTIKEAIVEGTRLYTSIRKKGAPLQYMDIGGGLGVDYDGSQSSSDYSMNYSLEEYISNAIYNIQQICDEENEPHPNLVSESGRAITAHHSCLVMNVIGSIAAFPKKSPQVTSVLEGSEIVKEVKEILANLSPKNALESYHDATGKLEEAINRFKLGMLSLEERGFVEESVKDIRRWILQNRKRLKRLSDELEDIIEKTATQYLVNFSVFQSAPDHWAFDQLFPIVPLHRMLEMPRRSCSLADITCDSDGVIDRFIARRKDFDSNLWLHQLNGKPYYLGMFLTGAYQDIMGDLHNLFGRVNEVHVFCDDDDPEDFYIQEVIMGDTIASVIEENQFAPFELAKFIKTAVEEKVKSGKIKPRDGVQLVDFYERVMQGYTYLRN
ncbi:MAG: biosynthetic arginine decarboxylase [Deltaproteobacteria bacterium]|nr:biosynthetic arginine decarboxylase [Deltaproteobacteria bacterium]